MGDEAMIKGAVIRDTRDWMRTAYGPTAYATALAKLSSEERALIDGTLLAASWYPIAAWDRMQEAMREEALKRKGHGAHEFNMRNMREAGSLIVRNIYKILLGLVSAQSVMTRSVVVFNRIYSEGRCEVVENEPGRAVIRYCGASPAFRTNLTHNFVSCLMYLLELNGTKDVDGRVSRDEVVDGKLIFETTITYRR
jgi:hypothetical protein